jgi:hypothetical protein
MPKACPKCNHALTEDAAFCDECGHELESSEPAPEAPAGADSGKGSLIGEGARVTTTDKVVGGDYKEGDKFYGTTNIVKGPESEELKTCDITGREVKRTEGRACQQCERWVCLDKFLDKKNRCQSCEEKAEGQFMVLLKDVYDDGIVEPHERRELKQQASEWKIDPGRALDMEKPFRVEATPPLGKFHQMQLEEAKRLLLEELNPFGCWESLQPVFEQHRSRDDEVGEEVRHYYLLCNIEHDPAAAMKFTLETLDEYDDPHSYFIQMEYFERKGDRGGIQKAIGRAESKLPDHACVQGAIMKHCLDQYVINKSKTYMDAAKAAFEQIKSGYQEPFIPALQAYWLYLGSNDSEAFQREEEKAESAEGGFYIRKLRAQLNASKLSLEVNGTSFDCHHGDILGRKGDVAKVHLGAVPHIHGKHAEVFCCFGQWYIRALPGTQNPTYIDEHLVEPGEHHKITGEHRLRLSTMFEAKLKVVPVNPNDRV